MLWEINEHELNDLGLQKARFDISSECTEAEFYAQCIDYEKQIAESCQYDPEFIMKVEDLCDNYTLDELQKIKSVYSEDLFSAKNDLLTFLSLHSGELTPEQQADFNLYVEQIEDTILCCAMLDTAIEKELEDE